MQTQQRAVTTWWNTVRFAEAKSLQFVLKLSDDLSLSIDWHCWPIPTRVMFSERYVDKGDISWGRGVKRPVKTGSSLVAVVYFGGDSLFEFGELILREGAGQDLGTPFDEVVDHVTDRVEHLTFVSLTAETDGRTWIQIRHRRTFGKSKCSLFELLTGKRTVHAGRPDISLAAGSAQWRWTKALNY